MVKNAGILLAVVFALQLSTCSTKHEVEVKPVEVKPIHITIDVNVRVEKALDDYFSDIDEFEEEVSVVDMLTE